MQFSENIEIEVERYKLTLHSPQGRLKVSTFNFKLKRSGDDGVEETLLSIPNRKVKLYCANGTAWATVWESRTLPGKMAR